VRFFVAIAGALCALTVAAHADTQDAKNPPPCPVAVTYDHYSVSGTTREELKKALLSHGPSDPFGKRRYATATWHVRWKWELTQQGLVDVSTLELSCSAVIKMPKLVPVHGMPKELLDRWQLFMERLLKHEMNHVRHAEERAGHVVLALRAANARRGMLTPTQADAVAQKALQEIRELDRQYDERTDHGKTEGVWEL
jgi:predicted secreted Zn-dependent protease